MEQWIYFKSESDRKKAEQILKERCPELFFSVSKLGEYSQVHEVEVHFGKWDINLELKKLYFEENEFLVSEEEYSIIEFLVNNYNSKFSISEIAYALNSDALEELEIKIDQFMERTYKCTGESIIQKIEKRYYFKD